MLAYKRYIKEVVLLKSRVESAKSLGQHNVEKIHEIGWYTYVFPPQNEAWVNNLKRNSCEMWVWWDWKFRFLFITDEKLNVAIDTIKAVFSNQTTSLQYNLKVFKIQKKCVIRKRQFNINQICRYWVSTSCSWWSKSSFWHIIQINININTVHVNVFVFFAFSLFQNSNKKFRTIYSQYWKYWQNIKYLAVILYVEDGTI